MKTSDTGCDETDPLKPGPITVSPPNESVATVISKGNPPGDSGVLELVRTLKVSVTEKSNKTWPIKVPVLGSIIGDTELCAVKLPPANTYGGVM